MRQAPCQPNLLKFSNMCQRNYPAPSDIYLLPNPDVARLAHSNVPPAQMMSQGRRRAWPRASSCRPKFTPYACFIRTLLARAGCNRGRG